MKKMFLKTLGLRIIVRQPGLCQALAVLALGSEWTVSCRAAAGLLGRRRSSSSWKRRREPVEASPGELCPTSHWAGLPCLG